MAAQAADAIVARRVARRGNRDSEFSESGSERGACPAEDSEPIARRRPIAIRPSTREGSSMR